MNKQSEHEHEHNNTRTPSTNNNQTKYRTRSELNAEHNTEHEHPFYQRRTPFIASPGSYCAALSRVFWRRVLALPLVRASLAWPCRSECRRKGPASCWDARQWSPTRHNVTLGRHRASGAPHTRSKKDEESLLWSRLRICRSL